MPVNVQRCDGSCSLDTMGRKRTRTTRTSRKLTEAQIQEVLENFDLECMSRRALTCRREADCPCRAECISLLGGGQGANGRSHP